VAPVDATWWAERLLDRYGVVAREHVDAERPPVAWGELSEVWKRMELRGQVRRGYFVEGLAGSQFAWPSAVEVLRAEARPATVLVSVCDPACAHGAVLPLDVARLPSNFLVLAAGRPLLILEMAARRVRLFERDPAAVEQAAAAVATVSGAIELAELDGAPAPTSPLAPLFRAVGFELDGDRLRRSPLHVRPLT
jgi:ATP-dependent Lhr-like helicase